MLVAMVMRCYGSAGNDFNNFPVTNALVWSDGRVFWGFSATVKTDAAKIFS